MKGTTLDARRRLTMPPDIEPLSAVTVEHTDTDTWIVRRVRRTKAPSAILVPPLTSQQARRAFRANPRQEAFEAAMAASQVFPLPDA
ncbi:MAG: hypothetical protein U1G08_15605 [Verrucomicrobiota bacterium]